MKLYIYKFLFKSVNKFGDQEWDEDTNTTINNKNTINIKSAQFLYQTVKYDSFIT